MIETYALSGLSPRELRATAVVGTLIVFILALGSQFGAAGVAGFFLLLVLGCWLGSVNVYYEAQLHDKRVLHLIGLRRSDAFSLWEVNRVVRLLTTSNLTAWRDPPGWTKEQHLQEPKEGPEDSGWSMTGFRVEHGGAHIVLHGRDVAALCKRIVDLNPLVALDTECTYQEPSVM